MSSLELTAVLLMASGFETIRKTISAINAQTAAKKIELIIVAKRENLSSVDRSMFDGLGAYQIIEVDDIPTGAAGWSYGIPKAQAPVIVLTEDHCYPEPTWAQALIDAHKGEWAAVAPMMSNGNPRTVTSWANFLLNFITWFAPDSSHEIDFGPGHNTSYKRDVLSKYFDNLAYWLNPERVLHYDLQATGFKIYLESTARVHHINISQFGAFLGHSFHGGRIFGDSRTKSWGIGKRLIYSLASPLIPVIRLWRITKMLNTPQKRQQVKFPRIIPHIVLGLIFHAAGEVIGYWAGEGNSPSIYINFEARRRDFVLPGERTLLLE